MNENYRNYQESDYLECEELVNQAWRFDHIFSTKPLSDVAKSVYTKGSVLGSNYRKVVEVDGKVAGFIFGLNENRKKPGKNILFLMSVMWRLGRIDGDEVHDKNKLLNAMKVHEVNRTNVVGRGESEIVLFVIDKEYQGRGFGKALWSGFKAHCEESGVSSVIVETNKKEASGFYEALGFTHIADFNSPLHEFATEGGQACMYRYKFES